MYLITDHKIHQVKAGNIGEEHWEEEREGKLTHGTIRQRDPTGTHKTLSPRAKPCSRVHVGHFS